MNAVLPAAVNAMVQTRSVSENKAYIETAPQQSLLEAGHTEAEPVSDAVDYSRVGLSSFLKKYGQLTEQDFTLFAAYFDEKKNRNMCFSIEDVKRYYAEARRYYQRIPACRSIDWLKKDILWMQLPQTKERVVSAIC